MSDEELLGPPRVRRRLAELAARDLNFDLAALAGAGPAGGWQITDVRQPLPAEAPGMPVEGGSWEIARRLMRGYEFADPSIVRAYYDSAVPLERRDMLLRAPGTRAGVAVRRRSRGGGLRAHARRRRPRGTHVGLELPNA